MKRTLTLIAGAVLIASLAACGPKNGGKTKHGGDMVEGPGGAVTQELSEKAKEV
jgi:hypothetical protein